jgi:hypothetical protein
MYLLDLRTCQAPVAVRFESVERGLRNTKELPGTREERIELQKCAGAASLSDHAVQFAEEPDRFYT